ncbi:MAG: HD domain-containing phosphohydrolase [Pseudohongiellaceae bacterium]
MNQQEQEYLQLTTPEEVGRCLDVLMQHRGASLVLEDGDGAPLPVVVLQAEPGEPLLLDISSVPEVAGPLGQGAAFRLLGQEEGKLMRSAPLVADECREEEEGALRCLCPFPESFSVLHRRDEFRAAMRLGLECDVMLRQPGTRDAWDGKLRNLSMRGCLLEFPLGAATMLSFLDEAELELCFPSGRRFVIQAVLRHQRSDMEQRQLVVGFEFSRPGAEEDRQLWFFVCEIERETARHAAAGNSMLAPSRLFRRSDDGAVVDVRRKGVKYPTPMARSLAGIAEFLDTQILALRTGDNIDAAELSRQAERLLALLEQDREAVLFATVCLDHEPALVRHCLGVAVRLVDLADNALPRPMRKLMMASAMVHDMGQVLLPREVQRQAWSRDGQGPAFRRHIDYLLPRLQDCSWLSGEIRQPVIEQANERLDGSGYPHGLQGGDLHELARMMAVVDEADRLSRAAGEDDKPWPVDVIQRHLQSRPLLFDQRWVRRYFRHFGEMPVGTLLRYPGQLLAWVRELDEHQRPARVQLTSGKGPPSAAVLGDVLEGETLAALGAPQEVLAGG